MNILPSDAQSVGYTALIDTYNLSVLPHYRRSYVWQRSTQHVIHEKNFQTHIFAKGYTLKDASNPFQHIEFSLKYDGINLEILSALFVHLSKLDIEKYVQQRPNGKYTRMVWYLYEKIMNVRLAIEDVSQAPYVLLLDPLKYYTAQPILHKRYRVKDNLLGNVFYSPMVRRTEKLALYEKKELDKKCLSLIQDYESHIITRAMNYLYTKETMSSFEIEREKPSTARTVKFTKLLAHAGSFDLLSEKTLIHIQNAIVDKRFGDTHYRTLQNYVGSIIDYTQHNVHYMAPRPEDVRFFMKNLLEAQQRMLDSKVHPMIIAAVLSFNFVLIHPFQDGNGRIHRFLIHHILAKTGFTPPGIIIPVSAVMLSDKASYDRILESFSNPLSKKITNYTLDEDGKLAIHQVTKSFYQYIDVTHFVEYLFACFEQTMKANFKKELDFLVRYDRTKEAIKEIIDMPDKLIDLFIMGVQQNGGTLSQAKKHKHFAMLTEKEIGALESVVEKYLTFKTID